MMPGESAMPPKLLEVLAALTDRELALRLKRVWDEAAACSDRLSRIDFEAVEPKTHDDAKLDAGTWRHLRPTVEHIARDLLGLLNVMHKEFAGPERAITGEYAMESSSDHRVKLDTSRVFTAVGEKLQVELKVVQRMLETPPLGSSQWAVVAQLQKLRTVLRRRVGETVYLSAAACASVRREEVVPGFGREVRRAARFRAAVADLRRSFDGKLAAQITSKAALLTDVMTDFELFTHLPVWRHVRAEVKRQYLQALAQLRSVPGHKGLSVSEVRASVAPVLSALGQLAQRYTREILAEHDRAVIAEAGARVEQATLHLDLNTGAASSAFSAALKAAEALYGRAAGLDDFIRYGRARMMSGLSNDELLTSVLELKTRLETLSAGRGEGEAVT